MNALLIVILGVLQGLLEWIPISSQGNLVILMTSLFGVSVNEALSISIYLHTGTMLAAIVYYRREIKSLFKSRNKELLNFFLIATLITAVVGGLLYFFVRGLSTVLGSYFIALIGISLIITGLIQWRRTQGYKSETDNKDALITGIAQGFSIIPGISRSGVTTSTLLFRGLNASTAIKLSFMLSIPAILIAEIGMGVLEGFVISAEALLGIGAAFVTGLLMIGLLTRLAQKLKFAKMCIILGALSLIQLIA